MKFYTLLLVILAGAAGAAVNEAMRDPFARPRAAPPLEAAAKAGAEGAPEAPAEPALQLRAVMYETGHSLANINGRILAIGESIGDYRLTRIQERSVTLSKGGVQRTLVLDQESTTK